MACKRGRCSIGMACVSTPYTGQDLSTPSSSLDRGECSSALTEDDAVCCSQSVLDGTSVAGYRTACQSVFLRWRCGLRCSPHIAQSWDPGVNRLHLCADFCHDFWVNCYAVGASSATQSFLQSEAAFCAYNSGPGRANASSCWGWPAGSSGGGGTSIGVGSLLAPSPPPSPPRPPYSAPQGVASSPAAESSGLSGGLIVVMILIVVVLVLAFIYCYRSYLRGAARYNSWCTGGAREGGGRRAGKAVQ